MTYPLWQYKYTPLSAPTTLSQLDYQQCVHAIDEHRDIVMTQSGTCHAVVVWTEYQLSPDVVESTGLTNDGGMSLHDKQNVRFMPAYTMVAPGDKLMAAVRMNVDKADFEFSFVLV